jgi:hypothetical protein
MSYETKCAEVIFTLVDLLKQVLSDHEMVLDDWLSNGEAVTDLGELYRGVFTDVFGSDIITSELGDRLYLFGMNLVFALQTFQGRAADMDDLHLLGSTFLLKQMDTLHIWCDELENAVKAEKGDIYGEF